MESSWRLVPEFQPRVTGYPAACKQIGSNDVAIYQIAHTIRRVRASLSLSIYVRLYVCCVHDMQSQDCYLMCLRSRSVLFAYMYIYSGCFMLKLTDTTVIIALEGFEKNCLIIFRSITFPWNKERYQVINHCISRFAFYLLYSAFVDKLKLFRAREIKLI